MVFLNRSAGSGDIASMAPRLMERLRQSDVEFTVEVLRHDQIAASAMRAAASGSSLLVAGGGDGTVNTVASVARDHHVRLGVLPLGTMNHFARDLGIPTDLDAAAGVLTCGRVRRIDTAEVNGRLFLNNSSIGLYPRLVWERKQRERRGRGRSIALIAAALQTWRQYRRMTVSVEERGARRVTRTPFVFVGNNEYTLEGGRIDRRARIDAGVLQLCLAPGATRGRLARIVIAALAGRLKTVDGFEAELVRNMTVAGGTRRLGVSLDGEFVVLEGPLHYRIQPQTLDVVVP